MLLAGILVLCWGLVGGQTAISSAMGDSATGGVRAENSAIQLGGSLTRQGTAGFTSSAKQINSGIGAIKANVLKGGVDVFNQFLDAGGRIASGIPLFGPALEIGTSALKSGANLVNAVGQNVINTTHSLVNTKLDVIDGILQAGAGAVIDASNANAVQASQGAESAVKALNDATQGSNAAFSVVSDVRPNPQPPTASRPIFNYNEDLFY